MDRRGFLGSILAACAAPAIVRADSLMRILAPETLVLGVNGYLVPRSDAMWAGAIREIWQYDIVFDLVRTRFDVLMQKEGGGGFSQYHVDIQTPSPIARNHSEPAASDAERQLALRTLKNFALARGEKPARGLELPNGGWGRFL